MAKKVTKKPNGVSGKENMKKELKGAFKKDSCSGKMSKKKK